MALYRYVNNPECRQYMLRQAFEEALHTDTFIYCCDSLALDLDMVYGAYNTIPSIKDKDDFVVSLTKDILNPFFSVNSAQDMQTLVKNIIGFYVIMEGIFFYAGFAQMLYLRTKNKMIGVAQQFEYIMRDESIHLAFGCDLINTIKKEHPAVWTEDFQKEIIDLIKKAVWFETRYIYDSMSVDGQINPDLFIDYIEYIADKRLLRLELPEQFFKKNPFPWMSTATDLSKEKNFFETKVTEYQTGSALEW
jgi:ribonucleoside-diphosphate reductase beta chain